MEQFLNYAPWVLVSLRYGPQTKTSCHDGQPRGFPKPLLFNYSFASLSSLACTTPRMSSHKVHRFPPWIRTRSMGRVSSEGSAKGTSPCILLVAHFLTWTHRRLIMSGHDRCYLDMLTCMSVRHVGCTKGAQNLSTCSTKLNHTPNMRTRNAHSYKSHTRYIHFAQFDDGIYVWSSLENN